MSSAKSPEMHFEIAWRDSPDGVAYQTLASIALLIDGTPVWPVLGEESHDFQWFADELLAHLTECWKPLILRQTYPIAVQPGRPSCLMTEATKRWSELRDDTVQIEQQEIAAFEDVHNLANAFGGVSGLLPLWFLRDRDRMIIDTQETLSEVPIQVAIDALTAAGDHIGAHLVRADKQKWQRLMEAWRRRDNADDALLLALTIGRDKKTAEALLEDRILEAPQSFADAANDNDQLRLAARMAGPLPVYQIKTVIEKVRTCRKVPAPKLDETVDAARNFLESQLGQERPYVQGSELAKWLRRFLQLSPSHRIDPFNVLKYRGVDFRAIEFDIPTLDGIAVWGTQHGPSVLLNKGSARFSGHYTVIWRNGAARVTAAHELCHLVLDSKHALSAVDILGGRMPLSVEQRAKAFAAEFLLPSEVAATVWEGHGYPLERDGLGKVVSLLRRTHGVTSSVAAWQVEHGATSGHRGVLAPILDQIVPQR